MKWNLAVLFNPLLNLQTSVLGGTEQGVVSDASHPSLVTLKGYGSFLGTTITESLTGNSLPSPVDAWLGIDYAIQPIANGRFAPVAGDPARFDGVRNATRYGHVCVQNPDTVNATYQQDEACLNFNVFRPAGVPLQTRIPALVWIHGGGFVADSARSMDGASFVASSRTPLAVVTFNYRLNSLGFLPSKMFVEEGLLNLGLRDQKYMLQFLHKHAPAFGIDVSQITLGGRSAGAHSASFHYFHNYAEDRSNPLFTRAIFQSGAVTARAFPNATYPLNQRNFERYMDFLKCPHDDNLAGLQCLRQASIRDIQTISSQMYADSEYSLNWPFQPAIGGPLLEKAGSLSGRDRSFHHLPIITSTVTDEGKFYTPGDLHTNDDFISYMHNISPGLNYTDMAIMNELYPEPVVHPNSVYSNSPNSTQYNRVSAAWSDYAYICPSRETAMTTAAAGVPTWKLRFNTPSYPLEAQTWRGVPHTSDTRYTFDSRDVPFRDTAQIYHAYLASFVATGDPNAFRLPGSPFWPRYEVQTTEISLGRQQAVVNAGNNTLVEDDAIRIAHCEFWNDMTRMQRMNK